MQVIPPIFAAAESEIGQAEPVFYGDLAISGIHLIAEAGTP
jgi:hypothetical protein